jgi:multidrug efflux pump subunit AcrB
VILALVSVFILSLTVVPALIAIAVTGRVREGENAIVHGLKRAYAPALAWVIGSPLPVIAAGALLSAASLLLFMRVGQECSSGQSNRGRGPRSRGNSLFIRPRARFPCAHHLFASLPQL